MSRPMNSDELDLDAAQRALWLLRRSVASLIEEHGSFRRVAEAYWFDLLTPEDELVLEDALPKETLASYKPLVDPQVLNAKPHKPTIEEFDAVLSAMGYKLSVMELQSLKEAFAL